MKIKFLLNTKLLLFFVCILSAKSLFAAKLEIPKSLNSIDRRAALEVLGTGSQLRLMGDPYPLGGYWGIDLGVSRDAIPTSSLSELGTQTSLKKEVGIWSITLGKGLYYNVDAFLNFVPFGQEDQVSSFGGGLRWLFYEMSYRPIYFSLQGGANSASFQNLINFSNQSLEVLASMVQKDLTFYTGLGVIRSTGIFIGGVKGVTQDSTTQLEALSSERIILGVSYRWKDFYGAVQVDRAILANYALKAGYRF